MRCVLLAVVLALAGCASAPIKKQDIPKLAQADARVLEGCYDCLLEARDTYNRLAVGKARPLVIARLFETQLLIAMRERELSLDSARAFGQARELAREMPPLAEAERYIALAEGVAPDTEGTPREEQRDFGLAHVPFSRTVNDQLQWLRASTTLREPVRQYLALSVDCSYVTRLDCPGGFATSTAAGTVWTGSLSRIDLQDAPPLVTYRAAFCTSIEPKAMERVRALVPEFAEAAMYLGRTEVSMAAETGSFKARDLYREARDRFPDSTAINYLTAFLMQASGDCRTALDYYDKAIARKRGHERALLGRTACLSFLKRHAEAIDQATRMIEMHTDNWGDAFYWRAWNHHAEKHLDPARADVERAKSIIPREETFTLAGMIEHDQDALDIADSDLTRAKALDRARTNCVARWYLGLVSIKKEKWVDSSKHFEDAMVCYDARVKDSQERLAALEARTDLDPEFRAKQIAGFQVTIEEDRSQYYAAAFNTANQAAQSGDPTRARRFLDMAAIDPALAKPVAELREILGKAGG